MATTTIQYVDPLDRPGTLAVLIEAVRSVPAVARRGTMEERLGTVEAMTPRTRGAP